MIQTKLKVKINPKLNPLAGTNTREIEALSSTVVTKAWRLRLLYNRLTSGMVKSQHKSGRDTIPGAYRENTEVREVQAEIRRKNILSQVKITSSSGDTETGGVSRGSLALRTIKLVTNKIVIINPNTTPATQLEIQGKPWTMDINPESSWTKVKSMGRNNPFMIYTGSEDIISFEVTWYSSQDDREDVITKCKLLESWTKADGYLKSPPTLFIQWGNSDLFKDDMFVLTKASYVLSNFQNSCRMGNIRSVVQDLKLYPNSATQSLTFERVTANNRLHENIVSPSKVSNTIGINTQ